MGKRDFQRGRHQAHQRQEESKNKSSLNVVKKLSSDGLGGLYRKSTTLKQGDIDRVMELDVIKEEDGGNNDSIVKPAKKSKWTKVRNIMRTINLLKNQEAKKLEQAVSTFSMMIGV